MRNHFLVVIFGFLSFVLIGCNRQNAEKETELAVDQSKNSFQLLEKGQDTQLAEEDRRILLDSVGNIASNESNDTLKLKYLSKLSLAYLYLPDSIRFRKTNKEVMQLSLQLQDTNAFAEAHWDRAQFYASFSKIDSAFYNYSEANKLFTQQNNNFLSARMLYNMAVIQAEVKDYTGSEINTIKAIELFSPLETWTQLYLCYNNLGSITKELEEYDRALEYYDLARFYQEKIKEPNSYGLSLNNNVGVVYQEMGEHRKAVEFFKEVTAAPGLVKDHPRLYARALNNLAYSQHILNMEGNYTDDFKLAVHILDSIEDWQGVSRGHYNGAIYYRDLGDTAHAMAHANLAMDYAIRSKNNKRLLETMELMVILDPKNASEYTQAYIKLDDSLQKEERAIRNKFARIRFETDEFIAQNELLARQRQLWIGIAGGVFLLGFSILIIIIQRIKNQRLRFQQQQQEANQEIFNLMLAQNQKLEEGKQSEQRRISEELHDGILGEMNGVRMVLLGLNKKADEATIALRAQAITKLQQIQEEIRTISHALSDASYRKFHNFVVSLQELLKNIGEAAGLKYELTYDEDIEWDALKGDIKINLYRIIQESLQNCVKHAKANKIYVNLHGNSNHIEVTIKDDGQGFNSQDSKKGIGHKNIQSRVRNLKGSWQISSSPGQGTTVKLRVPYGAIDPQDGLGKIKRKEL